MFCDTQKIASSYETDNKLTIYLLEFCCTQPFIFPCLRLLLAVSFGDTEPYASGSATLFSEDQFDGSTAHCIRYADPQHTMALRTVLWLQKHRLVEVGRHLLRSSTSTPLLKQDQPQQVAQDYVQMAFEYLHSSLTLTSLTVELLSYAQTEFQLFQFLPVASWPVSGHYSEESGSLFFIPPTHSGLYTHWWDPPWAFSSLGWTIPALSLSSYESRSNPFIIFI